jgi:hypothetical protein
MSKFYKRLMMIVVMFSNAPTVSNAGFLTNLLGLGSYKDCIEVGLKKTTTSREIKEIYDACKKDYPAEQIIQGSTTKGTSLPLVPIPKVPVVLLPLVPAVPTPAK